MYPPAANIRDRHGGGTSNSVTFTISGGVSGPTPGFWESSTGDEFYVSTDRANVNRFAIYVTVSGCATLKITVLDSLPISSNQFSFTGSFYGSGTFDSATAAHGVDGLSSFYSSACSVYLNGGPWNWSATWKNSSQPSMPYQSGTGNPGIIEEPVSRTGVSRSIARVKEFIFPERVIGILRSGFTRFSY